MIGFQDRLVFENKSNDLLAVGELLIDMISNEYDDTFQSAGYTRRPVPYSSFSTGESEVPGKRRIVAFFDYTVFRIFKNDNDFLRMLAYAAVIREGTLHIEGGAHMQLETQPISPQADSGRLWKRFKKQKMLHLFVGLGMVFLVIFSYTPMFGILMAFKDYSISSGIKGIFTSDWVGLKYFDEFIHDYQFGKIVRNTLVLSFLKVIFAFPAPILLAIMLNEVKNICHWTI